MDLAKLVQAVITALVPLHYLAPTGCLFTADAGAPVTSHFILYGLQQADSRMACSKQPAGEHMLRDEE